MTDTQQLDTPASYSDAANELKAIVAQLEAGELGVDDIVAAVERANTLIEFCRQKVEGAQTQIRDITARALASDI